MNRIVLRYSIILSASPQFSVCLKTVTSKLKDSKLEVKMLFNFVVNLEGLNEPKFHSNFSCEQLHFTFFSSLPKILYI